MNEESLELMGLKMEYPSLMELYIKRGELRHKIIELTLTIAAAFLGVALTKNIPASVSLAYPPIATLLAIEWTYHEKRQIQTRMYLRKIEMRIPELGLRWENQKDTQRGFRFLIISHGGIFLFTQSMAIFIGCLIYDINVNNWRFNNSLTFPFILLIAIDLICLIITFGAIYWIEKSNWIEKSA